MTCSNQIYYKNITLGQALLGGHFIIQLNNGHLVRVELKPGSYSGQVIRLKKSDTKSGNDTDTYISLKVLDDPVYGIDGLNLKATVFITPAEAKLGGTKRMPGPDGKEMYLKIMPDTINGQKIVIKGGGLSDKKNTGDIVYRVRIIEFDIINEELDFQNTLDIKNQLN